MKEILHQIKKFKELKGVVIGDLMLDIYSFGRVDRISPEAPVPVIKIEREEYRAGGAANVASNLKALGAEVSLVGIIGEDENGRILLDLLKSKGIDTSNLLIKKRTRTIVKNRFISKGQQLLRVDHEDGAHPTRTQKDSIIDIVSKLSQKVNFIIIEDYNKGLLSSNLYREIIKNSKAPIFIDPKFEYYSAMKNAFLIKPNFDEFRRATRLHNIRGNIFKHLESFRKRLNAKNLVVTKGEDGMFITSDTVAYHIPSLHRNVYDVTGAGDMVISILALSMSSGLNLIESSILATIAAGIEITKLGAEPITPEELLEEIQRSYERLKREIKVLKEQS
ncbi:MAG: bifunctional ADP-heptose synthase [candidate division WOR-3 bacterium]